MSQFSILSFLLATGFVVSAQSQIPSESASKSPDAPLYQIVFEKREPVAGIDAPPAFRLPFDCTSDGTAFITMLPAGGLMQPPLYTPPPLLLISVSPSGQAHTFPLDQPTQQLYNVREVDHYASDSAVVFLIRAASENKPLTRTWTKSDGTKSEYSDNRAERRLYLLFFDHDGNYKKTSEVDVGFNVQRIGVFPSGTLLAFGDDETDHSPKLAMLKDDGTFTRFLQIRKGDAPESIFQTKDGSGKGAAAYIAPTEFVPFGHTIVLVQNRSAFPLLEVSEGGTIRAIHPHMPNGVTIDGLIASDLNLYVRIKGSVQGSIYEIDAQSGAVSRRFETDDAAGIACVHDGKFLSFDHGDGKLVLLVGTAELSRKAGSTPPEASPPKVEK